jgi:hypothetical protein
MASQVACSDCQDFIGKVSVSGIVGRSVLSEKHCLPCQSFSFVEPSRSLAAPMDEILDCLYLDDEQKLTAILANVGNIDDLCLEKGPWKWPPILEDQPPLAALSAFCRAPDCFRVLTTLGCDHRRCDHIGRSLDHFAAAGSNITIIDDLQVQGHSFDPVDGLGNTPLHYACEFGRSVVVEWLWRRDVDMNPVNRARETPLFIAARIGYIEIVSFLID